MTKQENIMIVDPKEYDIEESKALEITGTLPLVIDERKKLEEEYKEVLNLDIEDNNTSKIAKELRMKIKKNRTQGIEPWYKKSKEFFLRGGQFVDAIKRSQVSINLKMEDDLIDIENHFENKEKERKEKLKQERISILKGFEEFVPFGIDLGDMREEEFYKVLNGAKLQKEDAQKKRKEEEEKEKERIKKEKEKERDRIIQEEREREKKRKDDERIREEQEKKRKEKEYEDAKKAAEKNKEFLLFLAENNFDKTTMEWKQVGDTFEIWTLPKKIAEITI